MSPAYQENPDHVPNPMFQTGNVDTTGVTGDLGGRIENISPIFAQAKADAFAAAVEAIDDPNVDESRQVVLPDADGEGDRDTEIERLRQAADDAANDPQLQDPAMTPAAQEAADEGDDDVDGGQEKADGASSSDDDSEDDGGEQGDLPAADDSKNRWIEYAKDNDLTVDQGLRKDEYVAAVKKAKKEKDGQPA